MVGQLRVPDGTTDCGAGPVSDSFDLFLGSVSSYFVALISLHVRRCVYFYCMFDLHDWLKSWDVCPFLKGNRGRIDLEEMGFGRKGLGEEGGEETVFWI